MSLGNSRESTVEYFRLTPPSTSTEREKFVQATKAKTQAVLLTSRKVLAFTTVLFAATAAVCFYFGVELKHLSSCDYVTAALSVATVISLISCLMVHRQKERWKSKKDGFLNDLFNKYGNAYAAGAAVRSEFYERARNRVFILASLLVGIAVAQYLIHFNDLVELSAKKLGIGLFTAGVSSMIIGCSLLQWQKLRLRKKAETHQNRPTLANVTGKIPFPVIAHNARIMDKAHAEHWSNVEYLQTSHDELAYRMDDLLQFASAKHGQTVVYDLEQFLWPSLMKGKSQIQIENVGQGKYRFTNSNNRRTIEFSQADRELVLQGNYSTINAKDLYFVITGKVDYNEGNSDLSGSETYDSIGVSDEDSPRDSTQISTSVSDA